MIRRALAMAAVVGMALASLATAASATNDKVTLCHNGHTITISENALKGHFDHEGQPARGHENDYLGACKPPPPPTTQPPPPTTIPEPPAEPEPPVVVPPVEVPPVKVSVPVPEAPAPVPVVHQPTTTG
jgi:outer membrane biosynthesis protein TonB